MPQPRPRTPSGRLGTQLRGVLSDQFHARRHQANDLIYTYSPRADADVVLRSSLEYAHFLLVESDPRVARVDYAPGGRVARLCGESIATTVDVEVVDIDGTVTWREIKYLKHREINERKHAYGTWELLIQNKMADELADNFQILAEKEIYLNPVRIRNWNRIVAWIAQARELSLGKEGQAVLALIRRRKQVRFEEMLTIGEKDRAGLFAAALFREVQKGTVASDLERAPLSPHSLFFQRKEET